jgi:hypothetical protein
MDMGVLIRPRGEELLRGGTFPGIYSDMPLVLDQDIIMNTLKEVAELPRIVNQLSKSREKKFQNTLLWMAKYDLVELLKA